jgi:hypothetical protein
MGFAYCLASLTSHTAVTLLANDVPVEFGIGTVTGTYIHTARQDAMGMALAEDATHLLWIDSDMEFPRDALLRLLLRNKAMVGVNYSKRGLPPQYVAIKDCENGVACETLPESTGLEEVEAVGFGMVLMDLRQIRPRLWEPPWFHFEWVNGDHVGEDVYFCRHLREAGVPIYVDHDLSQECGHIGMFTYKLGHVHAWQAGGLGQGILEDGADH